MADIKLNLATGDAVLAGGDLVLTNDENGETETQRLAIRFRMARGEWFLDTRIGYGIRDELRKKNPDLSRIDALTKDLILSTPGVARLRAYGQAFDRPARKLAIAFRVQTARGVELEINEEITP
ncbi:hypothetical protein D3C72_1132680 [compost metagenome]